MYLCISFFFFAAVCSLWDLSSPTTDWTRAPASRVWSLNQWTTREIPYLYILSLSLTLMRIPIRSMYVKFTPIFAVVMSLSVEYSLPPYFILPILNYLREFVLGFSWETEKLTEKLICFFLCHHNNNLNDCNSWPSHHQPGSLESNLSQIK